MKNIALILIVIAALFFFWKRKKKDQPAELNSDEGLIPDQTIGMGSSGTEVRRLQMKLNEIIARAVNEQIPVAYSLDGIAFNYITQPLVVDGKFGLATQTMLFALTGKKSVQASEIDGLTINFPI